MKNESRKTRSTAIGVVLIGAMVPALTSRAFAATYYVATTGSDSNSGAEPSPFASLQKAANVVNPGDTVIVKDGVYPTSDPTQLVEMWRSGTATAWITFKSEHALGAKLAGQNNETLYMLISHGRFFKIQDFDIYGFKNIGIVTSGSNDIAITGNSFHDIGRLCDDSPYGKVGVYGNSSPNITIEGNEFHDIGRFGPGENGCSPTTTMWVNHDHGVYLNGMDNVTITSNKFYNLSHGWGIQVYSSQGYSINNALIKNNAFYGANPNRDGQIVLAGATSNSTIDGNLFHNPRHYAISYGVGGYTYSNVTISNNKTYGAAISATSPPGIRFLNNSSY